MSNAARVSAVIVTFNPEGDGLRELLTALRPQVASGVIVDNGSANADVVGALAEEYCLHFFACETNLGIAAAQNRGMTWALREGATHVLLSDQDSIPAPDMVGQLLECLEDESARGEREGLAPVAAVGPVPTDARGTGEDESFPATSEGNAGASGEAVEEARENLHWREVGANSGKDGGEGHERATTLADHQRNARKDSPPQDAGQRFPVSPESALVYSFTTWGAKRRTIPGPGEILEVPFVLASGCLIPREALVTVGPMNESLFIDHVDLAWCLRAVAMGYRILVCGSAHLTHALGEDKVTLPGGRQVHAQSVARNYFMVRNTLFLWRASFLPLAWKLGYLSYLTKYLAFYTVMGLGEPRRLRELGAGVRDGLLGRGGPRPL